MKNPGLLKLSAGLVLLMILISAASGQETFSNGKALNIPFRKAGISIGNSYEFNGIRMNFADREVIKVNGINITLWAIGLKKVLTGNFEVVNDKARVNGLSIGVAPAAAGMQPVNIGLLSLFSSPGNINGLSVAGISIASGGNINGLSFSGLAAQGATVSGIHISGLLLGGVTGINGFALAGLAVSSDMDNINGLALCPAVIYCGNKFNGAAIGGIFVRAGILNGVAVSGISKSDKLSGISIALYNTTGELHGLQLGLLNRAGNKRIMKILPLVNFHL